jgi:hypothetical protein
MENETAVVILATIQIIVGIVLFSKDNSFKKQLAEIQKGLNVDQNKAIRFQEKQLDEIYNLYSELVNLEDFFISLALDSHQKITINSYLPLVNFEIFSISTLKPDELEKLRELNYNLDYYRFLFVKRKYELFHDKFIVFNLTFIQKNLFLTKELRKEFSKALIYYGSKILQIRSVLDQVIEQSKTEPHVDEFFNLLNQICEEVKKNQPTMKIYTNINDILDYIFNPEDILNN